VAAKNSRVEQPKRLEKNVKHEIMNKMNEKAEAMEKVESLPPVSPNSMYLIDRGTNLEVPLNSIDFKIDIFNLKIAQIKMI
jgi:hypothetical protein